MNLSQYTKRKFLKLSLLQRHKKCADLLRLYYLEKNLSQEMHESYNQLLSWMQLSPFSFTDLKTLADRYHWHLAEANRSLKEHNLLPHIRTNDRPPKEDFLPIAIYLDHVRSAYNVGNILRTTEALRLGKVYFSDRTPFLDNEKVQRTAMGAADLVSASQNVPLHSLPRPLIALETSDDAVDIASFLFPSSFTLILGNEEYGVSNEALSQVDFLIEIPLLGMKNSLNIAAAFAIAAAAIRWQRA